MKWGVRRYQNPDGSLTAAGKARYNKSLQNYDNEISSWQNYKNELKEGDSDYLHESGIDNADDLAFELEYVEEKINDLIKEKGDYTVDEMIKEVEADIKDAKSLAAVSVGAAITIIGTTAIASLLHK